MAINSERARQFVETHGTALERMRLHAILDWVFPGAVPDELRALQNPDGGFPLGMVASRSSSLSTTSQALRWLHDLHLTESDDAQRALEFIVSRQTPRGIWRESANLQPFNAPPWMDPDSPAADVYTTALCASTIALLSNDDFVVDQAVAWLQTQQGRDGLLIGFKAHSSWLAVPAFERSFGQETRATRRLIAGLGTILSDEWPGSMLSALLQSLLDANYTRRTALVDRAWTLLTVAQQPDGSFTIDEGDDPVQTTLQALDVARRIEP